MLYKLCTNDEANKLKAFKMPPREKEFDAVCLVIDVGLTSTASGFLNSALRCASELVQRKLFSESLDRFGLVQFGAERTANPLDYAHVALMDRGLAVADWQVCALALGV